VKPNNNGDETIGSTDVEDIAGMVFLNDEWGTPRSMHYATKQFNLGRIISHNRWVI
jgi:hypothetical protein